MASVVITLNIMPEDTDVDLKLISEKVSKEIDSFGGKVGKVDEEPVAFGLKSLKIMFLLDESKGSTDALEEKIRQIDGVKSAEAIDVRRTIG